MGEQYEQGTAYLKKIIQIPLGCTMKEIIRVHVTENNGSSGKAHLRKEVRVNLSGKMTFQLRPHGEKKSGKKVPSR